MMRLLHDMVSEQQKRRLFRWIPFVLLVFACAELSAQFALEFGPEIGLRSGKGTALSVTCVQSQKLNETGVNANLRDSWNVYLRTEYEFKNHLVIGSSYHRSSIVTETFRTDKQLNADSVVVEMQSAILDSRNKIGFDAGVTIPAGKWSCNVLFTIGGCFAPKLTLKYAIDTTANANYWSGLRYSEAEEEYTSGRQYNYGLSVACRYNALSTVAFLFRISGIRSVWSPEFARTLYYSHGGINEPAGLKKPNLITKVEMDAIYITAGIHINLPLREKPNDALH